MDRKTTSLRIFSSFLWLLLSVSFSSHMAAQTIMIGTPSLGFTQACASQGFNSYSLSFTVIPVGNIQAGNQFIIELSSPAGDFTNPTVLTTTTSATSPINVNFAFPNTTNGEAYKIRVRSTAPSVTGPSSASFPAHFAPHNSPFSINGNAGTITLCEGGNVTLQVDNTGTASSPLYYSGLVYKWYKNFAVIPGATSATLNVTQAGSYYCIVDYGSCVMNSYSNVITVNVVAGINLSISTSDGTDVICSGIPKTLVASHQSSSYTYQWYKNNVAITGANNATYAATQEGDYKLKVNHGNCAFESNSIFLEIIDLEVELSVGAIEVLIPGEQIQVTQVNNGTHPTYQWKRDNIAIPNALHASYTVTQPGNYSLVVTENQGCTIIREVPFTVVSPNGFTVTINNSGDYTDCNTTTSTVSLASIFAQTTTGNIPVTLPNSAFSYQWLLNNNAITGATGNSHTINTPTQNGSYKLKVSITGFPAVESNAISIALKLTVPTITANGSLCGTNTVTLTSSETNTGYVYKWYKNNSLITGASTASYTTNQVGNYHLIISAGSCTAVSNTINLQQNTIDVTLNLPASAIIFPGETKSITATTNAAQPQFQWYRNNTLLNGETSATLLATQNGTYKVVVTQSSGCNAVQEATTNLVYPTSFQVEIVAGNGYASCTSEQTSVVLSRFDALTANGTVSILNNDFGYSYEWYKNGIQFTSTTVPQLTISSFEENGNYEVKVILPQFAPIGSNTITIQLGMPHNDITIEAQGTLCENGGEVVITSNANNPLFTYQWFEQGNPSVLSTESELIVHEPGNYYLVVTLNGCSFTTNTVSVGVANSNGITLNIPVTHTILIGTTFNVQANGGENYEWYFNNQVVSTTDNLNLTQAGTYVVKATIGNCEFETTFVIITIENNSIVIPNIITLNNDGRNDLWSIPAEYTNKEEVEVIIYSSKGKVVFRKRNYQNNWPSSSFEYSKQEPVYYYTISNNDEIIKKGSITVIE
jgi:gliding motility-associated-like protein